jgi:hypothetical protein
MTYLPLWKYVTNYLQGGEIMKQLTPSLKNIAQISSHSFADRIKLFPSFSIYVPYMRVTTLCSNMKMKLTPETLN